jgi:hypothetical protein
MPIGSIRSANITTVVLSWKLAADSNRNSSAYDYIRINCIDESSSNSSKSLLAIDMPSPTAQVLLQNFTNGGKLTCNLTGVFNNESSTMTQLSYLTSFKCPYNIRVFNTTQNSTSLNITQIESLTDGLVDVKLTSRVDGSTLNYTFPKNSNILKLDNLNPATPYGLTLSTRSFYGKQENCRSFNILVYTRPGPASGVKTVDTGSNSVTLEWENPLTPVNITLSQWIRCVSIDVLYDNSFGTKCTKDFAKNIQLNSTRALISNLMPFAKYTINLSSVIAGVMETDTPITFSFATSYAGDYFSA